jgi:hypothetical protein
MAGSIKAFVHTHSKTLKDNERQVSLSWIRRCDGRVSHTSYSELQSALSRPVLVLVGIYQRDKPIDEESYETFQENYRITTHYKTNFVLPDWFK